MAIRRLSTPCVKLASFRIFSPASGETRVRAQAVENAFFNSLLGEMQYLPGRARSACGMREDDVGVCVRAWRGRSDEERTGNLAVSCVTICQQYGSR